MKFSCISLVNVSAWMVGICCAVNLGSTAVDAAEDGRPPHAGPKNEMSKHEKRAKHRGPGMGKDFKTLDTDGDGFLSFEEFSQSDRLSRMEEEKRRRLFDYLDRKKDGKLHMRELRPHQPRWLLALQKEFTRLDADQSGGLDFAEFSKVFEISKMDEKEQRKIFNRLDRNKDQLIQRHEIKAHGGGPGDRKECPRLDLKKYDTNQSGGVDFHEYSKMPWVSRIPEDRRKKLFQKLDRDKDGEISEEEVKAAWSAQRKHVPPPHVRPHRRDFPHTPPPADGSGRKSKRGAETKNSSSAPEE